MASTPSTASAPAPAWSSSTPLWSIGARAGARDHWANSGGSPALHGSRHCRSRTVGESQIAALDRSARRDQDTPSRRGSYAAFDPAAPDQHGRGRPLSSPCPGRSVDSALRAGRRSPPARSASPRHCDWRPRATRLGRPERPASDSRQSIAPTSALATKARMALPPAEPIAPANRRSESSRIDRGHRRARPLAGRDRIGGRAALRVARAEREIGHLVVEEEAVDHPARAEDRFHRRGHRHDVAGRVADDEMRGAGRLGGARRGPAPARRAACPARGGGPARVADQARPRGDIAGVEQARDRHRARRPDRRHIGRGRRT